MNGSQETGAMPAETLDPQATNLRGRVLHNRLISCLKLFVDVNECDVHFFMRDGKEMTTAKIPPARGFGGTLRNNPAKVF
jgi:hypothetical protein